MAGKVDQYIDAVALDHRRAIGIGQADDAAPMIRGALQAFGDVVDIGAVSVAEDFETCMIMRFEHAGEQETDGMLLEVAGDIADAQAAPGRTLVREACPGCAASEFVAESARRGEEFGARKPIRI